MICVHAHPSEIEKMGAPALSHLVIAQMARIEQLEFLVAKLKRAQFGPKSEKLAVNEAQLTLCLSGSVIEAQPIAQTEPPSKEKPARAARVGEHPINRIEELLPWNVAGKLLPALQKAA